MNLYELTQDAELKVEQYKHPDISEWIEIVDPILKALGKYTINNDKVESITISHDKIYIGTSYSCRGCINHNDIQIPMFIIKSENPIKEANKYRINNEIIRINNDLEYHKRKIEDLTDTFFELKKELEKLK